MKIKVCGMKYPDNIAALAELPVDYMGLIFYPGSPRFAGKLAPAGLTCALSSRINKTGVFVDAGYDLITQQIEEYQLDCVQLHGNEHPDLCEKLNSLPGLSVIKAFNVSEPADFDKTAPYEGKCGYFLFDTKTPQRGGSGKKFDWGILENYSGGTLFFLSGGISPEDADDIKNLSHPRLYGLDLNSKFETEAGRKDIGLLNSFIKKIKS